MAMYGPSVCIHLYGDDGKYPGQFTAFFIGNLSHREWFSKGSIRQRELLYSNGEDFFTARQTFRHVWPGCRAGEAFPTGALSCDYYPTGIFVQDRDLVCETIPANVIPSQQDANRSPRAKSQERRDAEVINCDVPVTYQLFMTLRAYTVYQDIYPDLIDKMAVPIPGHTVPQAKLDRMHDNNQVLAENLTKILGIFETYGVTEYNLSRDAQLFAHLLDAPRGIDLGRIQSYDPRFGPEPHDLPQPTLIPYTGAPRGMPKCYVEEVLPDNQSMFLPCLPFQASRMIAIGAQYIPHPLARTVELLLPYTHQMDYRYYRDHFEDPEGDGYCSATDTRPPSPMTQDGDAFPVAPMPQHKRDAGSRGDVSVLIDNIYSCPYSRPLASDSPFVSYAVSIGITDTPDIPIPVSTVRDAFGDTTFVARAEREESSRISMDAEDGFGTLALVRQIALDEAMRAQVSVADLVAVQYALEDLGVTCDSSDTVATQLAITATSKPPRKTRRRGSRGGRKKGAPRITAFTLGLEQNNYDARKHPLCLPHDGTKGLRFRRFADDFLTAIAAYDIKDPNDIYDLSETLTGIDEGGDVAPPGQANPIPMTVGAGAAAAARRRVRRLKLSFTLLYQHNTDVSIRRMLVDEAYNQGRAAWQLMLRECDEPITELELEDLKRNVRDLTIIASVGYEEYSLSKYRRALNDENAKIPTPADRIPEPELALIILQSIARASRDLAAMAEVELKAQPADRIHVHPVGHPRAGQRSVSAIIAHFEPLWKSAVMRGAIPRRIQSRTRTVDGLAVNLDTSDPDPADGFDQPVTDSDGPGVVLSAIAACLAENSPVPLKEIVCWNCKGLGHSKSKCPSSRRERSYADAIRVLSNILKNQTAKADSRTSASRTARPPPTKARAMFSDVAAYLLRDGTYVLSSDELCRPCEEPPVPPPAAASDEPPVPDEYDCDIAALAAIPHNEPDFPLYAGKEYSHDVTGDGPPVYKAKRDCLAQNYASLHPERLLSLESGVSSQYGTMLSSGITTSALVAPDVAADASVTHDDLFGAHEPIASVHVFCANMRPQPAAPVNTTWKAAKRSIPAPIAARPRAPTALTPHSAPAKSPPSVLYRPKHISMGPILRAAQSEAAAVQRSRRPSVPVHVSQLYRANAARERHMVAHMRKAASRAHTVSSRRASASIGERGTAGVASSFDLNGLLARMK